MYPEQFAERVYAIALIDSPRTTYTFALLQVAIVIIINNNNNKNNDRI